MLTSAETIKRDVDLLTSSQCQQVAEFIAFIRFRDKRQRATIDKSR